jgi:glycosyltransferase involved in cell wall biosynthesis
MNRHFPGLRRPFITVRIGLRDRFFEGRPRVKWRARFPAGTAIGVCVGRLVATKNQALVIRALSDLDEDEREGIGVLLVGDGPQRDELQASVAAAGMDAQVKFVGHVPRAEMPDLLASADYGLFPSTTEGSSLAAAEALAAGLPVLCLDIPSMVETVGAAGIISSPERFAEGLVRMARSHASLRDAALSRGEASRVGMVRSSWAELYAGVTALASVGPRAR